MQGKLVLALAIVGILVVIGPANGCKLCGSHWCQCAAPGSAPLPSYSRSWEVEHRPAPLHLTVPVIQPPSLGLGGLGLGLGGGGGNVCQHCGGYNRGGGYHHHGGYSHREDYGYPRGGGFTCRCAPRRRFRYDDY